MTPKTNAYIWQGKQPHRKNEKDSMHTSKNQAQQSAKRIK
jgi:hypothetical protein